MPDLWLCAAPLKKGRVDWLAEKACELGVARLVPVVTRRTVVDKPNTERLRAHMIEAAEQCGRTALPQVAEPVKLTAQEYKLLSYLLYHKGKVVSRTELIEHIYDQDFDRDSNTIEVFVTRIRKKLGQDVITTIRGLGYSLDDPAAGAAAADPAA